MMFALRFSAPLVTVVVSAVGVLAPNASLCQTRDQSATEIIRFLTGPVNPNGPPIVEVQPGNPLTRRAEPDRAAANALVALGSAAADDLDAALNRIEQETNEGHVVLRSKWLLFAYARIRGPAAHQRLQAMISNRRLQYFHGDLDRALAIAFGLTAYVSAARLYPYSPMPPEEPRHALDRLILAWMQNHRSQMEEVLGPKARLDLDSLLANQSWSALRIRVWGGPPEPDVAIGFRFEGSGDWSKPEETLDQGLHDRRFFKTWDQFPPDADLSTQFVDRAGNDCGGRREIRFVRVPGRPGNSPFKYVVDEVDLEGLLRAVSGCALRSR